MTSFDLAGRSIGSAILRAIILAAEQGPVALDCRDSRFEVAFNVERVTFATLDVTGATFTHGCRLTSCTVTGVARFDRVKTTDLFLRDMRFEQVASFVELDAANLNVRDSTFIRYTSFDKASLRSASMRDVEFRGAARFRGLHSPGILAMGSVRFRAAASFHGMLVDSLLITDCDSQGPLQTRGVSAGKRIIISRTHLRDARVMELKAGELVRLNDATFEQPLALLVDCPLFDAPGARFVGGADIAAEPGTVLKLHNTIFDGPSLIATAPHSGAVGRAELDSLEGARAGRLTLEGLDLTGCRFSGLHRLDDVLISGRGQLPLAPRVGPGQRREVLADELAMRASRRSRSITDTRSREEIAEIYRALRKAREDSHDHPGAADFYYGEMEMRRLGAGMSLERAIIAGYRMLSGYGMRASRALAAFAVVVLGLALAFQHCGFAESWSYPDALAWTLSAAVSLTRPVEPVELTTTGVYLNVVARVAGPALLALAALALRSRVRR